MSEPETRPLLILDLDETLIHSTTRRLDRPPDFHAGHYFVFARPGLTEFLERVSQHFDLAVWSASSADYVDTVVAELIPQGLRLQFRWSRLRCTWSYDPEFQTQFLLKDLKKVKRAGYDLKRVLIIDDESRKLQRNYGNAVYVSPFEGDPDDRELALLGAYLPTLATVENLRILEKRNWRSKAEMIVDCR